MNERLPTGVDRVSLAYIRHFRHQARAMIRYGGRWIDVPYEYSQKIFSVLLGEIEQSKARFRWTVWCASLRGRSRLKANDVFFNTGHSGLDQIAYGKRLGAWGGRPVFFLHDLIPISHPEYCRPGEAEKHHRRLDLMLSLAQGLVVNSRATLRDLENYAVCNGRKIPPVAVAYLAPATLPQDSCGRPLDFPYFVILGTIESRKNHLLLLHIWRQLVEMLGDAAPRLVVIGQRGWECEQVVDLLDRCEVLQGFVVEKPQCSDAELAAWLMHAQALLFPSFNEGFGMPLVEALMLRVPVIASDLSVFREIAGNIPEYLDPLDGLGWRRQILAYQDDDNECRQAQLARMASYVPPTWAAHFKVVDDLLMRIDQRARRV
ncbi:MAG: glycosyltransferase family 1 protein [Rhodocyclaceae bacterium]|nr:glycosyltransferase family 1 protein [Rhodocyclaceae bacterium]